MRHSIANRIDAFGTGVVLASTLAVLCQPALAADHKKLSPEQALVVQKFQQQTRVARYLPARLARIEQGYRLLGQPEGIENARSSVITDPKLGQLFVLEEYKKGGYAIASSGQLYSFGGNRSHLTPVSAEGMVQEGKTKVLSNLAWSLTRRTVPIGASPQLENLWDSSVRPLTRAVDALNRSTPKAQAARKQAAERAAQRKAATNVEVERSHSAVSLLLSGLGVSPKGLTKGQIRETMLQKGYVVVFEKPAPELNGKTDYWAGTSCNSKRALVVTRDGQLAVMERSDWDWGPGPDEIKRTGLTATDASKIFRGLDLRSSMATAFGLR
jgi:hypothetical protein